MTKISSISHLQTASDSYSASAILLYTWGELQKYTGRKFRIGVNENKNLL